MPRKPREYKERMIKLDAYAQGWDSVWRDCADLILPWRTKFLDRGDYGRDRANELRVNDRRVNSVATMGVRLGAAGMMQGFTSPARPWFRLTTPDAEMGDNPAVKKWLYEVERRIRSQMQRSNVYQTLPTVYEHMLVFGPAAMMLDGDKDTVLRAYNWPVGSYRLACDENMRVDTIYRRVRLTVRQSVQKFGLEAQTSRVKRCYEKGDYDEPVDVIHAIEPNPDYTGKGLKNKPFVSVWVDEMAADSDPHLHIGGYEEFPVMTPRWGVLDEDVYGYSPAMDALGDIKALQLYERRKAQAADWINRPLLSVPASLKISKKDLVPGHVIYRSGGQGQGADRVEAAYTVPPQAITAMADQIQAHEYRINRLLHADLWLLMAESDKRMTATEVVERKQEKMQQLGAVVERVNDELAEPMVNRFFYSMLRANLLPEIPDELQGVDLRVEFISEMAQAQRMVGIGAIQQTAMFEQALAGTHPDVVDGFDADKALSEFAEAAGLQPEIIRSKEAVGEIRAQRAEQQQAQMENEQMMQQAQATKDLASAPMGQGSALDAMLETTGGPASEGAAGGIA